MITLKLLRSPIDIVEQINDMLIFYSGNLIVHQNSIDPGLRYFIKQGFDNSWRSGIWSINTKKGCSFHQNLVHLQ